MTTNPMIPTPIAIHRSSLRSALYWCSSMALILLLCPTLVHAQVVASQPFQVAWDANPASDNVTVYRCYVDNIKQGTDIPVASPRLCTVPGLTAGTHVVEVSAVNSFAEGGRGMLSVTAGSAPSSPTNLRIVVQVAMQPDGSVTLLAASVSKDPPKP